MRHTDYPLPVVMLSLNCQHLARQAVASVLAQDVPVELTVWDQASTDGVREWLRSEHRIAHLVESHVPVGVSKAWNSCLRYWFDQRHKPAVLVINNDVVLRPDTARALAEDGGGFVTAVGVNAMADIAGDWSVSNRPNPDYSCYLIRKQVWDRIGGFDESMVVYASDGDFHLRMHRAGIDAYTIGIPFYHYASGTLKQAGREEKVAMQKQADADRIAFEKKWGFPMGSPAYYAAFTSAAQERCAASSAP